MDERNKQEHRMKDTVRSQLEGGGELTIAAMDQYSRAEIGRKTYNFVRRCMRDPVLREKIETRAAEIRAAREGK